MALLEVNEVSLVTAGVRRLASVSANIDRGQIVAIVGPNGSGKSSLLSVLAGVVSPTSGEVLLDGRAMSRMRSQELAGWRAWLGQSTPGADDFTVGEVIRWGSGFLAEGTNDQPASLAEVARTFGVEELLTAPLHRLSGGQRQRVHLARTWMQGARVTLLDEPDASLDKEGRAILHKAVAAGAHEGRSFVVVTHDREWAASEAHVVWDVRAGEIVDH